MESPSAYTGSPFDDMTDSVELVWFYNFVQHGSSFSLVVTVGVLRLVLVSVFGVQCFVQI